MLPNLDYDRSDDESWSGYVRELFLSVVEFGSNYEIIIISLIAHLSLYVLLKVVEMRKVRKDIKVLQKDNPQLEKVTFQTEKAEKTASTQIDSSSLSTEDSLKRLISLLNRNTRKVVHEPVVFNPLIHDANNWLNSDFERTALANSWDDDEKSERVKAYLNVKVLDELMTSNLLIQIKWKHFSDWFINKYSDTTFNIKNHIISGH